MDEFFNIVAAAVPGLIAGLLLGLFVLKPRKGHNLEHYERKAGNVLDKSGAEAQTIKDQNKKRIIEVQEYLLELEKNNKIQCEKFEKLIISKEEQLNGRNIKLQEIRDGLDKETKTVEMLRQQSKTSEDAIKEKLIAKSNTSFAYVKEEILSHLEHDLELERDDHLVKYVEYLEEDKERLAKNIISNIIQRYSAPTSVEKKSSAIMVEQDEHKARIIGKNGEIILFIEESTGVDVIFNDSPGTIIVSCFDLVKRHIACETILKLLKERVVTKEKVQQKIEETKAETEKTLIRIGRETVQMLELENRKFPDEFLRIIGRLKFRTSYGQNILKHSFEVGYFTLMLGSELGLDMMTSKIGGFFHDLGKAIDQEVGGSHDVLTKEIMEKYEFSEEEIHAAWTHHDAIPQKTAEAMLVKAGDAISAGRPGARQESIERYLERIHAIEGISNSYEGVAKTYAISAGREVRVIIDPQQLKDNSLQPLAEDIAQEIQENVAYPGKIKINVIRRTKNIDYAKARVK